MSGAMTAERGGWRAEWHGGRLADVYWGDSDGAVDCFQVGPYDFSLNSTELGELRADVGQADLDEALREWVEEQGDCFYENVVAYR